MGLVWLTMVTSFPAVLIGFEWHRQGISLSQVVICSIMSCLILLAYAVPASQLGARTGLGFCALSRVVFGRWGTLLITANLLWIFIVSYGMTAVLMAEAVESFLHLDISILWMSVGCAFLMAFNNLFGFSGVANFARFFAAPALIAWVGYTFFKAAVAPAALSTLAPDPQSIPHPRSIMYALTTTSSFIIGFAVWGNEMDYWRFSKVGSLRAALPLAAALLIGLVVFPVAGWLVAHSSGITDSAAATSFMNSYSFGGLAIVGLIVLFAAYFASNDSNLFGTSAAIKSLWSIKPRLAVSLLALCGAITAAFLSTTDSIKALEVIAALNCVVMPTPTVIMLTEWFLRSKVFPRSMDFSDVPDFSDLPAFRLAFHWPALIALLSGLTVGIATSGLISSLEYLHIGICPLQAWLTSMVVYAILRKRNHSAETKHYIKGCSRSPKSAAPTRTISDPSSTAIS